MSEENEFSHIKEVKLGPGGSFTFGYKDFDEMMAHMRQAELKAMARILPEQQAMINCRKEQWYINIAVDIKELFIAGEAWSLDRARKEELDSYKVKSAEELSDEDRQEFRSSTRMTRDSRMRGYIFGRAYSEIEPRGELGSTHVTAMLPIDEAAFNEAREQDWRPDLFSESKSPNLRLALFLFHLKYQVGR
jgi:hypothetical protein